jgi:hypothetical protein
VPALRLLDRLYPRRNPPRWKCGGCRRKFSLTSQTLFHSRKLPVRDYLTVIALFVNGVKGTSALQISRDLNINPKSSFVLLHKFREAMGTGVLISATPFYGDDTPGLPQERRPHIIGPAPAFQGSLPVPKIWVFVAARRKTL